MNGLSEVIQYEYCKIYSSQKEEIYFIYKLQTHFSENLDIDNYSYDTN